MSFRVRPVLMTREARESDVVRASPPPPPPPPARPRTAATNGGGREGETACGTHIGVPHGTAGLFPPPPPPHPRPPPTHRDGDPSPLFPLATHSHSHCQPTHALPPPRPELPLASPRAARGRARAAPSATARRAGEGPRRLHVQYVQYRLAGRGRADGASTDHAWCMGVGRGGPPGGGRLGWPPVPAPRPHSDR